MTDLVLIRHAITLDNLQYNLIGQTDPALHPLGHKQCRFLAAALAEVKLSAIYSSPLQRAVDTAVPIAAFHPSVPLVIEPSLQEIHLGMMEGLSSFAAYESHQHLMDKALDKSTQDFAFPDGEPRSKALRRFQSAVHKIIEANPDGTIGVVTHGAIIGLWLAWLHGLPLGRFRDWQPAHASITRVSVADHGVTLTSFNDAQHIPYDLLNAIEQAQRRLP